MQKNDSNQRLQRWRIADFAAKLVESCLFSFFCQSVAVREFYMRAHTGGGGSAYTVRVVKFACINYYTLLRVNLDFIYVLINCTLNSSVHRVALLGRNDRPAHAVTMSLFILVHTVKKSFLVKSTVCQYHRQLGIRHLTV